MDESLSSSATVVEYLEIPLRRRKLVVIPTALALVAAVVATLVLPKRYRSSTLILVEASRAPDAFMTKANTDQSSKRLNTIMQEVLSRTRLERVIQELDPYSGGPSSSMVEQMRSDISIDVKGNDAFNITFGHTDPRKAQAVTQRLATLFIEEGAQSREDQVEGAVEFLDTQLLDARKELETKEAGLRALKEKKMGSLPEQTQANLATLQRMQLEQQSLDLNLRMARDRLQSLEKSLAERRLTSTSTPSSSDAPAELLQLQAELTSLRSRYTEEHPDVRAVVARIARLERQLAQQPSSSAAAVDAATATTRAHLEQARIEIQQLETKQVDLGQQVVGYQGRVEQAPRTEQEIASLTRDYEKLRENYQLLLTKKLEAQMAERLEKRWKGERFRILDPANLPDVPYSPNRVALLVGGLLGGLVIGIGMAVVAEFLDHSVKSVRDVEAVLPFPVLVSVPDLDQVLALAPSPRHKSSRHKKMQQPRNDHEHGRAGPVPPEP